MAGGRPGRNSRYRDGRLIAPMIVALLVAVVAGCSPDRADSPNVATTATAGTSQADRDTEPDIAASVFQVRADRCASPENAWTTGFAIEPETIATVAHALVSTTGISVIDVDGNEHQVEVAYVDDGKDIALLRLLDASAPVVPPAGITAAGDVWAVTFKHTDEAPVVKPASVEALIEVTMDGQGARDAIKLTADISVGDSGGPIVTADGHLLGMIFATTIDAKTGWAIAEAEMTAAVAAKNAAGPQVIPPTCGQDKTDGEATANPASR